jgi:hypothetical protein
MCSLNFSTKVGCYIRWYERAKVLCMYNPQHPFGTPTSKGVWTHLYCDCILYSNKLETFPFSKHSAHIPVCFKT